MFSLGNGALLLRGCDKSSTLREDEIAAGEEVAVEREPNNPAGHRNAVIVKNKDGRTVGRVAREDAAGCGEMLDGLGALGVQFMATFVTFGTEENRHYTDTTATINVGFFYVGDATGYNEKVQTLTDFLQGKLPFASFKASMQRTQRAAANVSPAPAPASATAPSPSPAPASVDVAKDAVSAVAQLAEAAGALENDNKRLAGERGDLEREVKRLKSDGARLAGAETANKKLNAANKELRAHLETLQVEKGQLNAQLQESQALQRQAAAFQRRLDESIGNTVVVGQGREQDLMEGVQWRLVGAKVAVDDGGAFKQADSGEFIVEKVYQQMGKRGIFVCWARFETSTAGQNIARRWIAGDGTIIKNFKQMRAWIDARNTTGR